jgi:hypothetical protein
MSSLVRTGFWIELCTPGNSSEYEATKLEPGTLEKGWEKDGKMLEARLGGSIRQKSLNMSSGISVSTPPSTVSFEATCPFRWLPRPLSCSLL